MGLFDRLFPRQQQPQVKHVEHVKYAVGADGVNDDKKMQAFDNSNPTYSASLTTINYDSLLRDKQRHIYDLYKLADYYCDADPIVHSIIKHVYVPFASSSKWFLTCDNEKTISLFEQQYKRMRLNEKVEDIMLQFFKYGNVFVYIWKGNIMTLPPHKCRIGNTSLNGTPIVDFNVQSIVNEFKQKYYSVLEQKLVFDNEMLKIIDNAYPPQIAKAIKLGKQYAQLDPANTFVIQGNKEGWQRYCVPWIASALYALAKKQLISNYETSLLQIGKNSFVHVAYGDEKAGYEMYPDIEQLGAVRNIVLRAMTGNPIAVTNHLAKIKVIQADLSDLYQFPLYNQVNSDILSAGGISGIIVNGQSQDGSTFASAQVSMQAAAARIELARRQFEALMNKVNERLIEDIKVLHTNNLKTVPQFHFTPLDLAGSKSMIEACEKLWKNGVVSTKTYLETNGYNMQKQKKHRQNESQRGVDEVLAPRDGKAAQSTQSQNTTQSNESSSSQLKSDPDASMRGKQPKPSSPQGSMPENEGIS